MSLLRPLRPASGPAPSILWFAPVPGQETRRHSGVVQSAERRPLEPDVGGSSPPPGAQFISLAEPCHQFPTWLGSQQSETFPYNAERIAVRASAMRVSILVSSSFGMADSCGRCHASPGESREGVGGRPCPYGSALKDPYSGKNKASIEDDSTPRVADAWEMIGALNPFRRAYEVARRLSPE